MIDVPTQQVRTLAGSGERGSADGISAAVSFSFPIGLALSSDDRTLFAVRDGVQLAQCSND